MPLVAMHGLAEKTTTVNGNKYPNTVSGGWTLTVVQGIPTYHKKNGQAKSPEELGVGPGLPSTGDPNAVTVSGKKWSIDWLTGIMSSGWIVAAAVGGYFLYRHFKKRGSES